MRVSVGELTGTSHLARRRAVDDRAADIALGGEGAHLRLERCQRGRVAEVLAQ